MKHKDIGLIVTIFCQIKLILPDLLNHKFLECNWCKNVNLKNNHFIFFSFCRDTPCFRRTTTVNTSPWWKRSWASRCLVGWLGRQGPATSTATQEDSSGTQQPRRPGTPTSTASPSTSTAGRNTSRAHSKTQQIKITTATPLKWPGEWVNNPRQFYKTYYLYSFYHTTFCMPM